MNRLPFDPASAIGAEPVSPSAASVSTSGGASNLTVTQATELIKSTLEQRLPSPLKVVGQVSNLSVRNHWYFCLKDDKNILHCAAWATAARRFAFVPKDGDEVVATGHVSHYGPQGRTQLYVDQLAPVGAGALELRFRALCDELRGKGYFEEARKKPLPVFPRRIAVITSATGAAIQDVITTAAQRCKAIGLVLVDVRVQGAPAPGITGTGAAQEIARAIRWVDSKREKLGVDAMLVTRGGGSMEDLWAFNERIVADAVFRCHLPVVAAIGHESDTTIIELVADVRASTPTQAAMRLIPSAVELCRQIDHLAHRLGSVVKRMVERQRHAADRAAKDLRRCALMRLSDERARLERLATRLARLQPRTVLAQRQARLALLVDRLQRTMMRRIDERPRLMRLGQMLEHTAHRHVRRLRERAASLARQLGAMDPHGVLQRGYSITTALDGTIIKSVASVTDGQPIVSRVADGAIRSVVGDLPLKATLALPRTNGRRKPARKADQMDLFGLPH